MREGREGREAGKGGREGRRGKGGKEDTYSNYYGSANFFRLLHIPYIAHTEGCKGSILNKLWLVLLKPMACLHCTTDLDLTGSITSALHCRSGLNQFYQNHLRWFRTGLS